MTKKSFTKGSYLISTDKRKLNFKVVQDFLSNSYWAKGRKPEITKATIRNSVCFGLYHKSKQIGFARVISDLATFAYLADVFIVEEYRGRGLAKWFMKVVFEYEQFKLVKRWILATSDAHGLYRKFGFTEIPDPSKLMQMTKGKQI
jgi:GNAT superfamily N-acetyltransferase